ncbi:MAG: hypothetical protein VYE77_00285 [Planctomycetota bacterium]|nr:hypothetical protein [Planctomycetota bacterium]
MTMRTGARPWWLWLNILSLDAPLVALVWQEGFARSLDVELGWASRVILALCTWLAYSGDRILDAHRLKGPVVSARHEFARVHRRPLSLLWSGGLLIALALAWQLPRPELFGGLALLLVVAAYFALHHHPATRRPAGRFKEVMAGTVFALGSVYAVIVTAGISPGLLLLSAAWAGLCSANCLVLASWDREQDRVMEQPSLAREWPAIESVIPWVVGLSLLAAAAGAWWDPRWHVLMVAVAASGAGLLLLLGLGRGLRSSLRHVLADAVLLTPVCFLV